MIETNAKIDEVIQTSTLRINNASSDADISAAMSPFGYTAEKLDSGRQILNNTIAANQSYLKEYGDVALARENKKTELAEAKKEYMHFIHVCRVVFKKDMDAHFSLKLNGKRERSYTGAINQMTNFYQLLLDNEAWLAKASAFGCTAEKLQAALDKVLQTASYEQKIMIEKGEAQQATVERDLMVDELEDWMYDFKQIAKVALADKPQLLEKLQITVKNN